MAKRRSSRKKHVHPAPILSTGLPVSTPQSQSPAPTQPQYSDEQYATDIIEQEYGPKRRELQRARESTRGSFAAGEAATQGFGQQYDKRLQEIYAALRGELQQGQGAREGTYNSSIDKIKQLYDESQGRTQKATDIVSSGVESDAQRLGLQAALPDSLTRLRSVMAELTGYNERDKANTAGALEATKANALAFGQRDVENASREGASRRADTAQEVLSRLAEMATERNRAENQFTAQETDMTLGRQAALRQTIAEIQNARTERERQDALDAFAQEIQRNTLDLQRAKLGLSADRFSHDIQMDQANYGLKAADLQDKLAQSPLRTEKTRAEISNLQSRTKATDTQNLLRQTMGTKYPKGEAGVNTYFSEQKVGPKFQNYVTSIIQEAHLRASNTYADGRGRTSTDPYTTAINIINQTRGLWGNTSMDKRKAREAVDIYFGKRNV